MCTAGALFRIGAVDAEQTSLNNGYLTRGWWVCHDGNVRWSRRTLHY
jgi:hypothetical protein